MIKNFNNQILRIKCKYSDIENEINNLNKKINYSTNLNIKQHKENKLMNDLIESSVTEGSEL